MNQKINTFLIFTLAMGTAALAAFPAYAGGMPVAIGDECLPDTLGGMICNMINSTTGVAGLISGLAYVTGLIWGVVGIAKLRDHVESPGHHKLSDAIKRFAAAGAFFCLPYIADVVTTTIDGGGMFYTAGTGFAGKSSGIGLDSMIVKLVSNVMEPIVWGVGWVSWLFGLAFVFIGISRIIQTEQQGPKGPTGIGTITTFLIAGALFSLNSIITFINSSMFDYPVFRTKGILQYTAGMSSAAVDHSHAVISAIIGFAVILGWISVARGLFIVRDVSEGQSKASMMAAISHLIGGVLAINLGGVISAFQATVGITAPSIKF